MGGHEGKNRFVYLKWASRFGLSIQNFFFPSRKVCLVFGVGAWFGLWGEGGGVPPDHAPPLDQQIPDPHRLWTSNGVLLKPPKPCVHPKVPTGALAEPLLRPPQNLPNERRLPCAAFDTPSDPLQPPLDHPQVLQEPTTPDQIHDYVNIVFVFAYVWCIGGNIDQRSQEAFDGFVREHLETVFTFPGFGLCYDFQIDFKTRKFVSWEVSVKDFNYDPATPFFEILVPTIDTCRYSYLLEVCGA